MTLHLYDGLNVIRRRIEKDPLGRAPRSIVNDMQTHAPGDVHVWAFEGAGHLKARRALYPDYKNRPSTATDGFFALVGLIREALENTRAIQVAVPGYEADDVIAHLVCENADKTDILINTTDRDLNQLLVLPRVRSTAKPLDDVEPEYVRLFKTYVGDTSDSIPGLRGFGIETWKGCDKAALRTAHLHPSQGSYIEAGVPARLAKKAVEDHDLLYRFWNVVGFLDLDEISSSHLKVGQPDPAKADAILRRFNH